MGLIKWISLSCFAILGVAITTLVYQANNYPSLAPYESYFKASIPVSTSIADTQNKLVATYLGTSTVVLSDGETTIMTDGFFTRPSVLDLFFGEIMPNKTLIKEVLQQANITKLAAVIPVHSHHDHAMDAPEVAMQTGAMLVGSESTANIGRGWGLNENQIEVVNSQAPLQFGQFKVRLIASEHAPAPTEIEVLTGAGQSISQPLVFPAELSDFKEGGSYSVLIEHPLGNVLIHGSAGIKAGALAGFKADVVFLGIAGLGKKDSQYQQQYFKEVVSTVGATRIVPIHWDDFTRPFNEPLQPMIKAMDDFDGSMDFIIQKAQADNAMSIHMLNKMGSMDLYQAQ
ncbi:MAG: MBL fold metallo-hydrolase [Bermanella sp.]